MLDKINKKTFFLPKVIDKCKYILVRSNKAKAGLSNPYEGPFKVVRFFKKNLVIEKDKKHVTISIDRVKPFFQQE